MGRAPGRRTSRPDRKTSPDTSRQEEAMGRLGRSNTNTNTNTNTVVGPQSDVWTGVRYNSQEFPKQLNLDEFPAELPLNPPADKKTAYDEAQEKVNKVRFRKYWDAELRASVYLNEFITQNPDWLLRLVGALSEMHGRLNQQKGEELRSV